MFEGHVINRLKGWPALQVVGDRYEAEWLPQDAQYPAVSFYVEKTEDQYAHDGYLGISKSSFYLGIFGNNYGEVKKASQEIFKAIESWDFAGTNIEAMFRRNCEDAGDPESKVRVVIQEWEVHYNDMEG